MQISTIPRVSIGFGMACSFRQNIRLSDINQRVFRLRQRTRTVRQYDQIRLHNFSFSVDRGLWGQTVEVLIYDEALRIEQAEHLLVSYPCVYDTVLRRITTIDGQGRQPYRQVQVLQLALVSVELMRSVWGIPPYHWGRWPRGRRHARHASRFEPVATSPVHIRGHHPRTRHGH